MENSNNFTCDLRKDLEVDPYGSRIPTQNNFTNDSGEDLKSTSIESKENSNNFACDSGE